MAKPEIDCVWIEFDKPRDRAHGQEICEKANRMFDKLGITGRLHHGERGFELEIGSGYYELPQNGHWFNLDFVGS